MEETTQQMRDKFKAEAWRLMGHTDTDIARFAETAELILKDLNRLINEKQGGTTHA